MLFPGGALGLKVFEARYLDLVSLCLREQRAFGVVALRRGSEVRAANGDPPAFEAVGCEAQVLDVDSTRAGILKVRCKGRRRFVLHDPREREDGLWMARAAYLPDDVRELPGVEMVETVKALAQAIAKLKKDGHDSLIEPYDFTNAGWIANRWCELLPISVAAKQQLMAMVDPLGRLQLVDEFLRGKGIVTGK